MKNKIWLLTLIVSFAILFTACNDNSSKNENGDGDSSIPLIKSTGQIYLYGEQHGVQKIMEKQLELWSDYYSGSNMRHLFVELPYYTAEFLNIWMKSDNDEILEELYNDWINTAIATPYTKIFYKSIKSDCPETIFVGTDVGHQYNTTGERFLLYLENNNLKDSEQYSLTQEVIEQGKEYYNNFSNLAYRVSKKTENFIREFDKLENKDIMGIYGSSHTEFGIMASQSFKTMAERLKERYGNAVHSESLVWLANVSDSLRTDTLTINGKEYQALYYGEQDLSSFGIDFIAREFWRLENAYEDFKDKPKTGDVLPYNNFPMLIETGQVFVIDYKKADNSVTRMYYRSDGNPWNGSLATEEFKAE